MALAHRQGPNWLGSFHLRKASACKLRLRPADFRALGIPVKDDANLDISSYETLAQGFLLVLLLRTICGGRLRVRLPSLSDNVGAESVINRLYTSKQPLAVFVQRLAMWACAHAVSLSCSHIAGERNTEADALSRWDESRPVPCNFRQEDRLCISPKATRSIEAKPTLNSACIAFPKGVSCTLEGKTRGQGQGSGL